jgi:hypothetical protein
MCTSRSIFRPKSAVFRQFRKFPIGMRLRHAILLSNFSSSFTEYWVILSRYVILYFIHRISWIRFPVLSHIHCGPEQFRVTRCLYLTLSRNEQEHANWQYFSSIWTFLSRKKLLFSDLCRWIICYFSSSGGNQRKVTSETRRKGKRVMRRYGVEETGRKHNNEKFYNV